MERRSRIIVLACGALACAMALSGASFAANPPAALSVLNARVIATGIPGAGAVAVIGIFHPGGPIHDNLAFRAYTERGRVLDPARIIVASTSNFGAPAVDGLRPGSMLSIDAAGDAIRIPADFAKAGGQAVALGGRVQLFTSNSAPFVNGVNNPKAVTAEYPAISNPLAISINDAFGRFWFASAPHGASQPGFESIIDPNGVPLANAPDPVAGGVFTTTKTNRAPQVTPGAMTSALVANALLGMSPDGDKRAVFAVLAADGSITQAHAELGVDGLAPPGTITPQHGVPVRAGMLFNWIPNRELFVTDAAKNAIAIVPLADDTRVFTTGAPRLLRNAALHAPFDLAPAVPEIANGAFSSNTTLAGSSDLYVLNGDGTIVRMRQDGSVVAVRRVALNGTAIGPGRLAGIGTTANAAHILLTLRDAADAALVSVIEVPAFGATVAAAAPHATTGAGLIAFSRPFTPEMGLGPLFNERSCIACHSTPTIGGMGKAGLAVVTNVGHAGVTFRALDDVPIARAHSVRELGFACELPLGVPANANVTSVRNAPALYDDGAIDAIDDADILSGAIAYPDGVHGRPNEIISSEGAMRIGRFGWKADLPRLANIVSQAFRNELGITNPDFPRDISVTQPPQKPCAGENASVEDDGTLVKAVTAYVASLQPPARKPHGDDTAGKTAFASVGCEECHATRFRADGGPLYTDLLLHDMGQPLNDGFVQASARGVDWRTTALRGMSVRTRYLHDGRASTVRDAIIAHDGEAAASVKKFRKLDDATRQALVTFVGSL